MTRTRAVPLLLILTALLLQREIAAAPQERPNILVILADDLGFSDLGCYGGEMQTPNLDALAANGLRFTQFYNNARCCPSRASLMTGLYPHQTGLGHMMFDRNLPGYRGDLNRNCVTIAEVLKDAGYRTYAIGKWHLTRNDKPDSPNDNWPLQRGFEKYYGLIWGYSSFYDPAIVRGNTWYSRDNDPEYKSNNFYFTNALSDNAVKFLQQHATESPDKPFFMYAAYTAAHWPMHALEKDIAKYKGRFDAGYNTLRAERILRLREKGLIKPEWQVTPTTMKWDEVKNREWELRCMEVYAAMIDCMDQGVGQIVAELKRQGKLDNTLILFLQDNGGCAETRGRTATKTPPPQNLRPLGPNELPAGTIPAQTREGLSVRTGPGTMPGGPDTYIAYGEGWANVSNTPFREYKHWVHEGGISTAMIAHWPNGIGQARRNKLVVDPGHLVDIMATCVDLGGAKYPSEYKGEKIPPMPGVSLRPVLNGESIKRSQPLFWEHEGNRAMREGKWKLVAKENAPWELYDMEADRTEMHDLAADLPEVVEQLAAKWDQWASSSNVLPLGGWRDSNDPAPQPTLSRVEIKSGEALPGKSPSVANSPITVTVEILQPRGDGVLVAQGGVTNGYALYVVGGRLAFALRRDSELQTTIAEIPLGDRPVTVKSLLGPKGNLQLFAGADRIATQNGVGLLTRNPTDPLSAGYDFGDPVGDYPRESKYGGQLGTITIEVDPAAAGQESTQPPPKRPRRARPNRGN